MRKEHTSRYFPSKNKKCSVLIHRALDQWGEKKEYLEMGISIFFTSTQIDYHFER
jgi:hypothetical protein